MLTGKVAIVTGGAHGIGKAICGHFVEAGCTVLIADRNAEAAAALAKDLGTAARARPTDVAREDEVVGLMQSVERIDILVNNAGIMSRKPIRERPLDEWHRVLAVNLTAPYICTRHALPRMPKGSSIINIVSTRALMSEPDTEPYSASKGGLLALTHSLAVSLAPGGVRVNAISPGWIDVSGSEQRPIDHQQHPAGRVGIPDDIAHACVFLADPDKAGFITGANLVIDGGMTVKMIYAE